MQSPTLPDIQRFISALVTIAETGAPPMRAFAKSALRDMSCPEVAITEYLTPVICHPAHTLTPEEQLWRRLAQSKHISR